MKLGLNALGLIGARIASDGLSLVLFILISRHYGPAGTGDYSSGFALATIAFMAVCLGLDSYGVREFSLLPATRAGPWLGEVLGTQTAMMVLAAIGIACVVALTGGGVADYTIVAWLTAYQLFVAVSRTLFIPSVSREKMVWPAVADVLCRAIAVVVTLRIMQTNPEAPVKDVLIGYPIAGALLLAIAIRSAYHEGVHVRFHLSTAAVFAVLASLWSFAGAEIFQVIFSRLGLLSIGDIVGDAAAGQFSAGQKLLELACIPLVLIGTATFPRLVRLYETDQETFHAMALRLLWLMIAASGCIGWGIYYIAPPILVPLLGERFQDSKEVIQSMSAVAVVQSLESLMWPLLIAAHLQVARFKVIVAGTVASLALHLVLVHLYGLNGGILATFLSFLLLVVLFSNLLRRFLPLRYLGMGAATLLLAIALGLAVFSLEPASPAWWMVACPLIGYLMPVALGFWWLQHSLRSAGSLASGEITNTI